MTKPWQASASPGGAGVGLLADRECPATMRSVEVLHRDSSAADGVSSRGAGWHEVARLSPGASPVRPSDVYQGAAPGDLLRELEETGEVRFLYYFSESGRWLEVRGPDDVLLSGVIRYYGGAATQSWLRSCGGDWEKVFNAQDAGVLLRAAGVVGVRAEACVAAACSCAEASLGLAETPPLQPVRALRVARRWTRGAASQGQVRRAVDELYQEGPLLAILLQKWRAHLACAYAATSATDTHPSSSFGIHLAGAAGLSANVRGVPEEKDSTLAFLVRATLPLHELCRAIVDYTHVERR